jgi:MinD superfamily P-loop ATPase
VFKNLVGRLKVEIIVNDKCNLCGVCVRLCVTHVYEVVNGRLSIGKEYCIGCKACEILCPQKAIKISISDEGLEVVKYKLL